MIQHKKQPAGEAPPPPPSTWEEPYGGAKGESNGIIAILEMIKDDILKDKTKAKKDEDKAEKAFGTFKSEAESQIELNDAITDLEDEVAGKETKVTEAKEERGTKKDELDAVVEKIHDAEPGCDFIRLNFGMRTKNRDIEIDGLDKAKAILKGAKFEDEE